VISQDEAVKTERIPRYGSVYGTAARVIGLKRLPPATASNLVLLLTADEVVFVGVEREQNPEAPLRVYMEDHQVSIVFGAHLHLGAIAREEAAIVIDP
jgi:hypothetical protein